MTDEIQNDNQEVDATPDRELLARVGRGDRAAFTEVYDRYGEAGVLTRPAHRARP